MKRIFSTMAIMAIIFAWSMTVHGLMPGDSDGDGVPDTVDVCPAEDASYFDRNGDGCIDDDPGARHIEFWSTANNTITYVINDQGSPDVSNGSDFNAIHSAMRIWPSIAGTELTSAYGGTTAQQNADALDEVNMVTFVDNQYPFSSLVLAVGITTSFTSDSLFNGRQFRAGEIVDSDMIFNPSKTFKTPTSGTFGTDIQGTATHEAGHLYGLSHTAIKSATMYYVLPGGRAATTLETDDETVFFKAYADSASRAAANRIRGVVSDGITSQPVPGAIVFAISAASGDTMACEYTLPDGSYSLVGLPDGDFYVSIYPLNGSSPIGFLLPGNINSLVDTTAVEYFVPEYWDLAESNSDNPADKDLLLLSGGTTVTADLVTNVDTTPPSVVSATPNTGSSDIAIDGAYVIRFSEGLDVGTIAANFKFYGLPGSEFPDTTGMGGNLAVLSDDSVLAFTPSQPLNFSRTYELVLKTGLSDKSGVGLVSPYVLSVETEALPPLAVSSLSPNKGVPGNTVVINGQGFDTDPPPVVSFDAVTAVVLSGGPNQLVVTVPAGAVTGPVAVTNSDMSTSNSLTFTVLSRAEVARGYETGAVNLSSSPREISLLPDDSYAYIATSAGAEAIVVDPGLANYLEDTPIQYSGGLDAIATTPEGRRVYAVTTASDELIEIMSDPSTGLQFNTVLSSHAVSDKPLGIAVEPSGRRAYIPTDDAEIQIWDITLGSPTYQQPVGLLQTPSAVLGKLAFTPAGDKLLALTSAGDLLVYGIPGDSLLSTVPVGIGPYDVIVDAVGQRAYVAHTSGDVSVVKLDGGGGPFQSQDIGTGGSLRGLDITPGAVFIYATDRELDQIKIIDLDENKPTFRTVISDIDQNINPVDIELSSDGVYGFSILQGNSQTLPKMIVNTIGIGPALYTVYPKAAPVGGEIVLRGILLGSAYTTNWVEFSGGVTAPTSRQIVDETTMIVKVPPGAETGPIRIIKREDYAEAVLQRSNELYFTVLDSTGSSPMRLADSVAPVGGGSEFSDAIAINPQGTLAFVGGSAGEVFVFDIDPTSASFHQSLGTIQAMSGRVSDLDVTADGKALFVVSNQSTLMPAVDVDRNSPGFLKGIGLVDFGTFEYSSGRRVLTSPNNQWVLVFDDVLVSVTIIDATDVAERVTPVAVGQVALANVTTLAFHPNGLKAYIGLLNPYQIATLDLDTHGGLFGTLVSSYQIPLTGSDSVIGKAPLSMAPTPDGEHLLVHTVQLNGVAERVMLTLNSPSSHLPNPSDSLSLVEANVEPFGNTTPPSSWEYVAVSPRGDRIVYNLQQSGVFNYDFSNVPEDNINAVALFEALTSLDMEFTPDGSRLYMASTFHDSLRVFDFAAAQSLVAVSGDNQSGAENQLLPAALRVRVTTTTGQSLENVPVKFDIVTPGGGGLVVGSAAPATNVVVATDEDGFADVRWSIGSAADSLGTEYTVSAAATGLAGSPLLFTGTAVLNPETLPLAVVETIPIDDITDVSVTTAIQNTFSRAVEPSSVGSASVFLRRLPDGASVATAYGFTDGFRKVSLTPIVPLDYGTEYEVVTTAALEDTSGGTLSNPGVSVFSTIVSPPPPTINSISPPGALTGVSVIVNGAGFNPVPSQNTVMFNGAQTIPFDGSVSYLRVKVPKNAITGPVSVLANSVTSNTVPFSVLVPSSSPIDDVIANVGTGSGTKALAVTPDGAMAYTVSTDGGVVIPISVDSLTSYPSIPVGDQPVAIVIHPDGTFAYVANFGSSTVSVIDIRPASSNYNKVIQSIIVGSSPLDIIVLPNGDRVITANAGSSNLSIIDSNATSSTYHSVVATVGSGSGAKGLAVSPDGARIYVATDTGFVVLETGGYSVVANVGTGSGTKSLAVSPDGAILYVLTTSGNILVVDVEPGSSSENSVVATVGTGSGTKSLAVSPDGTLLYLIQEDSDEVLVVSITIEGGTSVLEDNASSPQYRASIAYVDTVQTGSDPSAIAFDPTGTGIAIITQAGENEVRLLNASPFPQGPLTVYVRVDPQTLNLQSRGRYVTGIIELPPAFAPGEIDVSSVLLNGVLPAIEDKTEITDSDGDGIRELIVKFDREEFQSIMPVGEYVPVTISGNVRDRTFTGDNTIRTIRPTVTHPKSTAAILPTTGSYVTWTSPEGYAVDRVDVHYSIDDGETWSEIATGTEDDGHVTWETPEAVSDHCRILVTLYKGDDVLGMGMSEEFILTVPVAIALQHFDAVVDEGTAIMRWQTGLEIGVLGFLVERSNEQNGIFEIVSKEMIPSNGDINGGSYEFHDEGILPNQKYWYKLREVTDKGPGVEFGPFPVEFKISNSLAQNSPNPFNPTTEIRFSIAEATHVRLIVYDVAGRVVRTLVNEQKPANLYKLIWDGRNDQGSRTASGVYFYRIEAGKFMATRKMILLK